MIVAVPTYILDAVEKEIDRALAGRPVSAEEREHIKGVMLDHVNQTGQVPSINLEPKS